MESPLPPVCSGPGKSRAVPALGGRRPLCSIVCVIAQDSVRTTPLWERCDCRRRLVQTEESEREGAADFLTPLFQLGFLVQIAIDRQRSAGLQCPVPCSARTHAVFCAAPLISSSLIGGAVQGEGGTGPSVRFFSLEGTLPPLRLHSWLGGSHPPRPHLVT